MTAHDTGVTELLRRASDGLIPDVDRLVSGGIDRGRSRQRRARIGTTVASLAVIGVVGGLAAVVPHLGGADSARDPGIATDGGGVVATETPTTAATPSPTDEPVPLADFTADEIPVMVVGIIGKNRSGRVEPTTRVVDEVHLKRVEFATDGMLTTVGIEQVDALSPKQCAEAAHEVGGACVLDPPAEPWIRWGPTLADGVTCQGVVSFRGGWQVYVDSCNAAAAKDAATLAPEPPISLPELVEIARNDVWFAP
ncbi:hypothetical protein [Nocardioides sp.]|uniref:hypothetical protein n=1 Tax=Nocardioides sp. TaxID=35761 RepID=UPI0035B1F906